jgi:protein gp37
MAKRLQGMGQQNYVNGFRLTLQPQMLRRPLEWKRPQMIFVNSMSDLFHRDVPLSYIQRVFEIMTEAHWHIFQILTKRADRLEELSPKLDWPRNVWMGVSVENSDHVYRIEHLQRTGAQTRFLSAEPLMGAIGAVDLRGIHWTIVGGESGPGARPMKKQWVLDVLRQCRRAHVPFFFKQWGGVNKKKTGRLLNNRLWNEMPVPPGFSLAPA